MPDLRVTPVWLRFAYSIEGLSKRGHARALLLAREFCNSNVSWLTFAISNAAAMSAVTPITHSNLGRETGRRPVWGRPFRNSGLVTEMFALPSEADIVR